MSDRVSSMQREDVEEEARQTSAVMRALAFRLSFISEISLSTSSMNLLTTRRPATVSTRGKRGGERRR